MLMQFTYTTHTPSPDVFCHICSQAQGHIRPLWRRYLEKHLRRCVHIQLLSGATSHSASKAVDTRTVLLWHCPETFSLFVCTCVHLPAGGGSYTFDVEQGPTSVFSRFFGTANPYEALNGEEQQCDRLSTQMSTAAQAELC